MADANHPRFPFRGVSPKQPFTKEAVEALLEHAPNTLLRMALHVLLNYFETQSASATKASEILGQTKDSEFDDPVYRFAQEMADSRNPRGA